jgi:hypothetical protein
MAVSIDLGRIVLSNERRYRYLLNFIIISSYVLVLIILLEQRRLVQLSKVVFDQHKNEQERTLFNSAMGIRSGALIFSIGNERSLK